MIKMTPRGMTWIPASSLITHAIKETTFSNYCFNVKLKNNLSLKELKKRKKS